MTQIGKFSGESLREPTLRLATGIGSDPKKPFIVGGLLRLDTLFGKGSDLTAALRLGDYGFVNGNWGIAVDLGVDWPVSGPRRTITGGNTATLIAGAPWGLQLELGGLLGTHDTQGFRRYLGSISPALPCTDRAGHRGGRTHFPPFAPQILHCGIE